MTRYFTLLAFILFFSFAESSSAQVCSQVFNNFEPAPYKLASLGKAYRFEWLQFNYLRVKDRPSRELNFNGEIWTISNNPKPLHGLFIFAMNKEGQILIGKDRVDTSSHAALFRGEPVAAAGHIRFYEGKIIFVEAHSGHYYEGFNKIGGTKTNLMQIYDQLKRRKLNLDNIQMVESFFFVKGFEHHIFGYNY